MGNKDFGLVFRRIPFKRSFFCETLKVNSCEDDPNEQKCLHNFFSIITEKITKKFCA